MHIIYLTMKERVRRLLIKLNPQWKGKPIQVPKFERDMLNVMLDNVKYKQIIGIVGLRRVGKTVLLKQLIRKLKSSHENMCYISFDDIDFQNYEIADDLINYFLEFSNEDMIRYLFLDEIQKLPNWADLLKTFYDTEENLKIFISGSASLEIKEYKETLAGRILTYKLPIFTFREFLRYFKMKHDITFKDLFREYDLNYIHQKEHYKNMFEVYLLKGAFPELLEINDDEFIGKYIKESVVEKTIMDISRITKQDEKIIYELFRILANSNAQLFEINNISNLLGVNRNLVSQYIGLLEKAFLIKISYNYTASVAKQVRTSKKQYCAHSSVVIAVLDYPPAVIHTKLSGHLVEATIMNHIEKASFWRTPQKDEVDIIVKTDEGIIPIEIKYQTQILNNDLKAIIKFCKKFYIKKGMVITKGLLERRMIDKYEILFIPAWVFLLLWGSEIKSIS